LCQNIASDFCADTSPEVFEEAGCAICGKLTETKDLSKIENINLLKVDGVTKKARSQSSDPIKELWGPILAPNCSGVCPICINSLEKEKLPTLALANSHWIGEIPNELQDLTYAEQLLIARVCHNRLVGVGHCFAWQDTHPWRIWHVACICIDQLTYVNVKHTCQNPEYDIWSLLIENETFGDAATIPDTASTDTANNYSWAVGSACSGFFVERRLDQYSQLQGQSWSKRGGKLVWVQAVGVMCTWDECDIV
jgi:hypothetical protein